MAYRNLPGYSTRHNNNNAPAYPSSPEQLFLRTKNYNEHHGQLHGQGSNLDFLGYYEVHRPSVGSSNGASNFNTSPIVHPKTLDDSSWMSISSSNSYRLALNLSNSPQNYGAVNHGQSPGGSISEVPQQISTGNNNVQEPWNMNTPQTSNMDSELEDMPMSDMQNGSFGSYNSLAAFSAANTAPSTTSENYVFPISNFDSAGNQIQDLALPGKGFEFLCEHVVIGV